MGQASVIRYAYAVKNKVVKSADTDSGILWVLLFGSAITTLYFNSKIQDPFNSPKLWIIMIMASWTTGHLLTKARTRTLQPKSRISFILTMLFTLSLLLSMLNTEQLYVGLFGENMRRNGFLAYLSLAIIFLATVIYFNSKYINRLNSIAIFVGLVLSIYGLMQVSGKDFVQWNNPYNAIISTVGNPNFAAAIMAVIAVLNFGAFLSIKNKRALKLLHLVTVILLSIAIVLSNARQGIISLALGIGIIVLVFVHQKNRIAGFTLGFFSIVLATFAILGMLQVGPLTQYLYKASVTLRGYYWDAGIRMFIENPLFGVGLDSYGTYFKEYRKPGYSLNYGWDITSTNAHNTPIQLFATGGVFVGLSYLGLIVYTMYRAFSGLKKFYGNQRLIFSTFFAAWLAFQAQSIVSIDNIGISIWGWLLSAIVISMSFAEKNFTVYEVDRTRPRVNQVMVAQPVVSGVLTISIFLLIAPLYRVENLALQSRTFASYSDSASRQLLIESADKITKERIVDPEYLVNTAGLLNFRGFNDESLLILKDLLETNTRNLSALNLLAEISEKNNDIANAIVYREQIYALDPWNARNLLQLGREYKFTNQLLKMEQVREKILSFASTKAEGQLALTELKK